MVTIKVFGKADAINTLRNKKQENLTEANQNLVSAGFFVQNEVKASIAGQRSEPTSVDTGRFLNSVDVWAIANKVVVSTDLEYAKFLEWGTSKMGPRAHFGNTAARSVQKVTEIIKGK